MSRRRRRPYRKKRKLFRQTRELRKILEYWRSTLENADRRKSEIIESDLTLIQKLRGIREIKQDNSGAIKGVVDLIQLVLDRKIPTPLLAKFARATAPKKVARHRSKVTVYYAAKAHKGQFNGSFSLNDSQRHAVHCALTVPANDFTCVLGPPGTGKTTLIQSIIASLYVEAALKGGTSRPPIIACTGATNQSVQNVIDCFERSDSDEQEEGSRWLPALFSYGTFCISQTRADEFAKQDSIEKARYHLEQRQGYSFSGSLYSDSYYKQATKYYLERASSFFDYEKSPPTSVKGVVQKLHRLLLREQKRYLRDLNTISGKGLVYWFNSLLGRVPPISLNQFEQALPALDTENRYQLFFLAARYWEGRWLLDFPSYRRKLKKAVDDSNGYLPTKREHWEQRAMLTPAFVSTLAMLPRFFYRGAGEKIPSIDYLICDEAGQIPVDYGAPLMALAKRALVVGDREQLEPMFSIQDPEEDKQLIAGLLGYLNRNESWRRLDELGVTASSGSLMKLAENMSRYADNGKPGAFLREQRRSVPEIVSFCNDLSYKGELVPVRKERTTALLPPFYHFEVKADDQKAGVSRVNYEEVEAIGNWIKSYEDKLLQEYEAADIAEVVAVITPHRKQADEIKRYLGELFEGMIAGTINSLQGAERPVVIFSTVYGQDYKGGMFFDRNTNMLNVAVSRARDSFLVFGNKQIFSIAPNAPSGLLGRYLARYQSYGLEPTFSGRTIHHFTGRIKFDLENNSIRTLADHRLVLRTLLEQAKSRLIIISPTVSSRAIKADNLVPLIRRAIERGVRVDIVADHNLTHEKDDNGASREGLEMLRATGANVHIFSGVNAIHSKVLAADGEICVLGSFNWLSANRNVGSENQKIEHSVILDGIRGHKEYLAMSLLLTRAIEHTKWIEAADRNSDLS